MSRKRHPPGERFLFLPYKLAMQLHAPQLTVLLDMARRHNGRNNGAIGYGCRDAARVARIGSKSAMLVLNQLHRAGHIVLRRERSFFMKAGRATREWYLPFLDREKHLYKGERSLDLPYWFLDSPGWRAASATQKKIYVELERRYDGGNNGRIVFTAEHGALLGFSSDGVYRALNGLQRLGFVVETVSADSLKGVARQWHLTRYAGAGKRASKDFMRPTENSEFGCCGATSEPVTVAVVRLGKKRGTPDLAESVATPPMKPAVSTGLPLAALVAQGKP